LQESASPPLELVADVQEATIEVNIRPPQAQHLAAAESVQHKQQEGRVKLVVDRDR